MYCNLALSGVFERLERRGVGSIPQRLNRTHLENIIFPKVPPKCVLLGQENPYEGK